MRAAWVGLGVIAALGFAWSSALLAAPVGIAGPERTVVPMARVIDPDEPLWSEPNATSPRRGAAVTGALLPVFETARGPGCAGRWLLVGPLAWACEDRVELRHAPLARSALRAGAPAPHRYYFVGPNGSLGYERLATAEQGAPDAEYDPGFGIAITRTERRAGELFGLTTKRRWVPMRDLIPIEVPPGNGVELEGELDVAWVMRDAARARAQAGSAAPEQRRLSRHHVVRIAEELERAGRRYVRTRDALWLEAADLRRPRPATLPPNLRREERWIDVDLARQVLTAYVGERPVFAALVSTGKSGTPTPAGEHRVWIKLRSSDMTNLEDADARGYYAMENVPSVMFFQGGYGLHGAFWHRDFGQVRSHGCVNLAPADAEWLFAWAGPRVPDGWSAALPTPYDPGTRIRVRP